MCHGKFRPSAVPRLGAKRPITAGKLRAAQKMLELSTEWRYLIGARTSCRRSIALRDLVKDLRSLTEGR